MAISSRRESDFKVIVVPSFRFPMPNPVLFFIARVDRLSLSPARIAVLYHPRQPLFLSPAPTAFPYRPLFLIA
jgi:hypothetical protein